MVAQRRKVATLVGVVGIIMAFPQVAVCQEERPGVTGDWSSQTACEGLLSLFSKQLGADGPSFRVADNDRVSVHLSSGACWAGVHRGPWGVPDHHAFDKAFGGVQKLESLALGDFVVYVIVNAKNPVWGLSVEDLSGIYRGQILDWEKVRGIKGRPINIFSPPFTDTACHILQLNALQGYEFDKRLRDWSAKPLRMKATSDGVIAAVAEDVDAIGFFLADHREKLDNRVKILEIIPRGKKVAVAASMENLVAGKYPLTQTLTMYLHPNAPREARQFCEFAVNPSNRDVLRKHKLFPQCDLVTFLAEKRLVDAKTGMGNRLAAIGVDGARLPFQDLATEYVRAKAAVQLSYAAVDADVSSIGAFVTGDAGVRELLLLGDKPSGRAMELHGEKWNALGVGKDGKPDGTGPAEYMIAGRAAAVIVNPANKLGSLTLGQIQAIFRGDVDDWAVIGGTGLQPGGTGFQPVGPAPPGTPAPPPASRTAAAVCRPPTASGGRCGPSRPPPRRGRGAPRAPSGRPAGRERTARPRARAAPARPAARLTGPCRTVLLKSCRPHLWGRPPQGPPPPGSAGTTAYHTRAGTSGAGPWGSGKDQYRRCRDLLVFLPLS